MESRKDIFQNKEIYWLLILKKIQQKIQYNLIQTTGSITETQTKRKYEIASRIQLLQKTEEKKTEGVLGISNLEIIPKRKT